MPISVLTRGSGAGFQPTTFLDLYRAVLDDVRGNQSETVSITIAKRLVNQALHDLHIQQNWAWAERRDVLVTSPMYRTGSLSIAAATRATLAGTNSLWNTTRTGFDLTNMQVGGKLDLRDGDTYLISGVTDDTTATLSSRYVGSPDTASAYALAYGSYTYFEDEYALASDFWRPLDVENFDDSGTLTILSGKEFYRRYTNNMSYRRPTHCTIIELGPSGSSNARRRLVVHPAPDTTYTFPYRYMTTNLASSSLGAGQTNMIEDSDEPIVPLRYRHVLVFYALAEWYRDRKDDQRSQEASAAYVDLVKRIANDSEPQRDRPRFQTMRHVYRAGRAGRRRGLGYWVTGSSSSAFDQGT